MTAQIIIGDCREQLRGLPDESVNCVVTSPPYFGLRDYGVEGQIGLEATPDDFVAQMVAVFREVRRVLRKDGTLWLNLGDSYASPPAKARATAQQSGKHGYLSGGNQCRFVGGKIKPKDLLMIPARVALALQADGWWVRGDHVWAKPNGMPESVTDRPTRGHEYVFLLTKAARYWYDAEAVRTAPKPSTITRLKQDIGNQSGSARANGGAKTNGAMKAVVRKTDKQRGHSRRHAGFNGRWDAMTLAEQMSEGSNLRSVWWVPPAQFTGAHFAVMPERVAEICILAGCPISGTVLDPFAGVGTTGLVAERLGRDSILIEMNPQHAETAAVRIRADLGRVDGIKNHHEELGPLFGASA